MFFKKHKGYVYVFKCGEYFKIGKTKHKIRDRLLGIRSMNPHKVSGFAMAQTTKYSELEKYVHSRLSHFHHKGEWFHMVGNKFVRRFLQKIVTDFSHL
jgi:hypothetical protein